MKCAVLESLVSLGILFASPTSASELITFEDFVPSNENWVQIIDQIPGITFIENVYVQDSVQIGNSAGLLLSAATSGSAAATTSGTALHFTHPVMQFALNVSPGFIALNGVSSFFRVDLIGFDRQGTERARSILLLRGSAATLSEVEAFVPETIEIRSKVPLTDVALRFDSGRVYFDDMTFTPASPEELVRSRRIPRSPPGSFEGLLKPWEVYAPLTDQIPDLSFTGEFFVTDPPYIGNSISFPLSGATSGNAAASTRGGTIQFRDPVREVSAYVSPGNISLSGASGFAEVEFVGLDASFREVARTVVSVRTAAETEDQIVAFRPKRIRLSSRAPLSYVTVSANTGRIYLDNLEWKSAHSRSPQSFQRAADRTE